MRILNLRCPGGHTEPVVLPVIHSCQCSACQGGSGWGSRWGRGEVSAEAGAGRGIPLRARTPLPNAQPLAWFFLLESDRSPPVHFRAFLLISSPIACKLGGLGQSHLVQIPAPLRPC